MPFIRKVIAGDGCEKAQVSARRERPRPIMIEP